MRESSGYLTTTDGKRLFYRVDDAEYEAPTIVFSNSLGTTLEMWDAILPYFADRYRVLRYDSRGHGRSDAPAGPYTIERLAADVIDVLDGTATERAAFCGLSLGGMVGQAAAAQYGNRFDRLILANTAPVMGTADSWGERIRVATQAGMAALRPGILERWFTPEFIRDHPAEVARIGAMLDAADASGYAASCAAIRDMDVRGLLAAIDIPTLVVVGTRDPATPPADGEFIAAHIPGARTVALATAHLSSVERPAEFSAAVLAMLEAGQ